MPFLYAIGAFDLAWCIAFVAVFVPGGIGLREGLLVYALAYHVEITQAFLISVSSRLLWTLAEIALVLLASLYLRFEEGVALEQE